MVEKLKLNNKKERTAERCALFLSIYREISSIFSSFAVAFSWVKRCS